MKDVTFIVKSFERPKSLERLINSIRRHYPGTRVIVADDSKEPIRTSRHYEVVQLPFDVGLSAGRNAALGLVTTPYFLLLDDDFEFTRKTDVERLLDIALECGHDIVGGAVKEAGVIRHYEGSLERDKKDRKLLRYVKGTEPCGNGGHDVCGMVLNFFLGSTQSVRSVGWDPHLKLAEHTDFFWRAKGKLDVAYCPEVEIVHHKDRCDEYLKYRLRAKAFFADFLKRNGFERSVNFDGDVYTADVKHPV